MKFYRSDLNKLIKSINNNTIKGLLLYGHNHGSIDTVITHLVTKLNLSVTTVEYSALTTAHLDLLANSQNFFYQRELIKVVNTETKINLSLQEYIINNKMNHFICFVAYNTLFTQGIRRVFEESKNLASFGCYDEDSSAICEMAMRQARKRDQQIENDALIYLGETLKGDHNIIKSELTKLFHFTNHKSIITLKDMQSVLSQDLMASGDAMCIFFVSQKADLLLQEIDMLKAQDKNAILMIRALTRYYTNILIVLRLIADGKKLDFAINSLTPPIFFKYKAPFKQIITKFVQNSVPTSHVIHALYSLQRAEVLYKTNNQGFDLFNLYIECHKPTNLGTSLEPV